MVVGVRRCYAMWCVVVSIHEQSMPHRSDSGRERTGDCQANGRGEEESVTEETEEAEDDDEGID